MTNSTDHIKLSQHQDGIFVLTFNRPQALNALNLASMQAFQDAILALHQEASLRVLILTGAGEKAFCSGGDLLELSHYPTEADALHFITTMGDALLHLEQLPVPVIAAINGYALGGGSEIALACDMRIADETVKMGMVQIQNKLTPGWGAGQRLLRTVGYARAMELLLKGEALRAPELQAYGLVNQIVPAGEALNSAVEFAQRIAQQPADVVRSIKTLLQAGLTQPYHQALKTEQALFPALWAAEPHIKAVEAFLQRQQNKKND